MEKQGYISVSEFATELQTSKQYVYKLIKGRLKDYVVVQNGKKLLAVEALEVMKQGDKGSPSKAPGGSGSAGVERNKEAELLQKLLQEKDARISDLQGQLAEANRSIALLQQLLAAKEAQKQLEAPKRKGLFSWFKRRVPADNGELS